MNYKEALDILSIYKDNSAPFKTWHQISDAKDLPEEFIINNKHLLNMFVVLKNCRYSKTLLKSLDCWSLTSVKDYYDLPVNIRKHWTEEIITRLTNEFELYNDLIFDIQNLPEDIVNYLKVYSL